MRSREDARAINAVQQLRDRMAAELADKKQQLEGIDMAIAALKEAEKERARQ